MVQMNGTMNMGICAMLSSRCTFHSKTWSSLRDTEEVEKGLGKRGKEVVGQTRQCESSYLYLVAMADELASPGNPSAREDGRRRTGLLFAGQKVSPEEEEEALAAALEMEACRQRQRCLAAKDRDSMTFEREITKTRMKVEFSTNLSEKEKCSASASGPPPHGELLVHLRPLFLFLHPLAAALP